MWMLIGTGLNPVLATTIGALVGAIVNYVFQFSWTFSGVGTHHAAIPAYVCTVVLGWAVNAGLYATLISFSVMGLATAQVCTTAAMATINFILYKKVVFHERVS